MKSHLLNMTYETFLGQLPRLSHSLAEGVTVAGILVPMCKLKALPLSHRHILLNAQGNSVRWCSEILGIMQDNLLRSKQPGIELTLKNFQKNVCHKFKLINSVVYWRTVFILW